MKLFGARLAPNVSRVKVYLIEKKIAIEQVDYDFPYNEMHTAHFKRMSATGRVPVLELDDGGHLVESPAIIEYLEELYPEPNMIGLTPARRAHTRAICSIIADLVLPIGKYVLHRGTESGFLEKMGLTRHPELAEFFLPLVDRGLAALETLIGDNDFLAGDRPTIADCHGFAILHACVDDFGYEFTDAVPRITAWYARFAIRPSAILLNSMGGSTNQS